MTPARHAPRRRARVPNDPYGIGPVGSWGAPVLAALGLLVVGWLTLRFVTAGLAVAPSAPEPGGSRAPGAGVRTPAPSNVVVVDPRADVPGAMVYVKSGNVWIQSGTTVRQLTRSGRAMTPSWSPDGRSVLYVETTEEEGVFPALGNPRRYALEVPTLMRVAADGNGEPEPIADGRVTIGEYRWAAWIRQPVQSRDGTIAVVSDAPNPAQSNVVVQLLDPGSAELRRPDIPENPPLGHQDPAWRPDGGELLFVRNAQDADTARGAPEIWRWDRRTGESRAMTGPGYLAPAWSRDGRWVAATKLTNRGTDVVVLDAATGSEVLRATDDGQSFSPVWSPAGDGIAFLHESGGVIDLRLAALEGAAPGWRVTETINLTDTSGLDPSSRPGWFIDPDDLGDAGGSSRSEAPGSRAFAQASSPGP